MWHLYLLNNPERYTIKIEDCYFVSGACQVCIIIYTICGSNEISCDSRDCRVAVPSWSGAIKFTTKLSYRNVYHAKAWPSNILTEFIRNDGS